MRTFQKRILLSVLILGLSSQIFAQTDPFMPLNPSTLGQGGSFTADAHGFNAFFYNPAGFADKGDFTLLSLNPWVVMDSKLWSVFSDFLTTGSLSIKSLNSKAGEGLPPEFTGVITALDPYISYLSSVSTDPAFAASVQAFATANASVLLPGIDIASLTTPEQVLAALDLPTILANSSSLAALLQDLTDQVALDTGISAGQPTGADQTALASAFDTAIASAATALPKGNLDIGMTIGVGVAGGDGKFGLGIGAFVMGNVTLKTPDMVGDRAGTILDARGRLFTSITLGLGAGISIIDDTLTVGIGIRPTLLAFGNISPLGLLSAMSGGSPDPMTMIMSLMPAGVYKGMYIGVDIGAKLKLGPIGLGVTIKDAIPMQMTLVNYGDLGSFAADLPLKNENGTILTGEDAKKVYYVAPLKVNAGISFSPELGDFDDFLKLRVGADVFDIFGFIRYIEAQGSGKVDPALLVNDYNVLDFIGVGGSLTLLNFIDVKAGFYKRMLTLGVGIDLAIIEFNGALILKNPDFTDHGGKVLGFTEIGASLEVAIRFD